MVKDFQEQPEKGFIPAQQGYQDRKMAKWQGFILSDHAELQKKHAAIRHKVNEPKVKQKVEDISECLSHAFSKKLSVTLQTDILENGLYKDDITGTVSGFEDNLIYIRTDSDYVVVELESIRHISILSTSKWFKSDDWSET